MQIRTNMKQNKIIDQVLQKLMENIIARLQFKIRLAKDLKMSNSEDKTNRTNGRWTKLEHEKFLLGLELYGKNWKKIEELLVTRTGSQIRSHAQKFFLKQKKPNEEMENFNNAHESEEQRYTATVISNITSIQDEKPNDYSYFLNKMYLTFLHRINSTSKCFEINFWEQFIDIKNQKVEESFGQIPRKDSFTMNESCNDSKIETQFQYHSILNEPIN